MSLKKKNSKMKRPFYLTIIIVLIIFLGSTFTYARLSVLDKKIIAQQKEIEDLKKTKMSLIAEVKGIKSSNEIQEEAMYSLGMVYPKQDQIVYVDLSNKKEDKDVNYNVFLSPIVSVLKTFTKN